MVAALELSVPDNSWGQYVIMLLILNLFFRELLQSTYSQHVNATKKGKL